MNSSEPMTETYTIRIRFSFVNFSMPQLQARENEFPFSLEMNRIRLREHRKIQNWNNQCKYVSSTSMWLLIWFFKAINKLSYNIHVSPELLIIL